jgi:hypothetical protein
MDLEGIWVADETDHCTLVDYGNVFLEFGETGDLKYVVKTADSFQIMNLRYQVDGNTIITDQPSAPHIQHTDFLLGPDGVLTLAFNGIPYRFKRRPDINHPST